MPKKTKINVEENEVKEIPATPRTKTREDKVKETMKEVKSDVPTNEKSKVLTVEVPIDFLRNVRNVVYATSERVQWKTEELFPVGLVVKQLDQLLNSIDQDLKKQE
jgi:hypothetical protein